MANLKLAFPLAVTNTALGEHAELFRDGYLDAVEMPAWLGVGVPPGVVCIAERDGGEAARPGFASPDDQESGDRGS